MYATEVVSVPYGDLFYFYPFTLEERHSKKCFRPLWGSFLFLSDFGTSLKTNSLLVSVPYGDLFYFYNG